MSDERDILEQIKELDRKLAFIGNAAGGVCRHATAVGAKWLAKKMSDVSPVYVGKPRYRKGKFVRPGGMKRSFGGTGLKASGPVARAKAGLDVGKKGRSDDTGSHGHLYIKGTAMRWTGFVRDRGRGKTSFALKRTANRIRYTGISPPHMPSFVKQAANNNASAMWQVVADSIEVGIAKAIAKQGL